MKRIDAGSALNTYAKSKLCSRFDPLIVSFELQPEPLIIHSQVSVVPTRDCLWRYLLHFLRQDTDIKLVAATIAEAIEAETIVEMAEKDNVMFIAPIITRGRRN